MWRLPREGPDRACRDVLDLEGRWHAHTPGEDAEPLVAPVRHREVPGREHVDVDRLRRQGDDRPTEGRSVARLEKKDLVARGRERDLPRVTRRLRDERHPT